MNTQNTENGNEVVLVATSRTAIGKTGGMLHTVDAAEMAAHVLKCAVAKAKIKHLSQIDKVVCGQAVQSYFAPNIARVASQMAGLPESIDCFTVQQQCASGMNALYQIYSEISCRSYRAWCCHRCRVDVSDTAYRRWSRALSRL
jgi:acetyl-CoA C-acetyltransferase